ncbi:MAG: AraC family transcriptional regulator [Sphingomonas sp.]|uniref:helix-turn-helix domain-containing protein n=1 Tax=Sphingomonas sp. TaxID=28214 RepID=UPI00121F485D|nr:helix-turn-helix domain-containing protein [Sphingomonas sp.]THD36777.1 MAG: AraC family transcriptional regulator [Sphingomonas sp.]
MTDRAADRQPTDVRFHLPAPSLRALVTSYCVIDAPDPVVDFTHPEWANIRFLLRGDLRFGDPDGREMTPPPNASIMGPTDRSWRFDSNGGMTIGIGFTPIGWLSLIGTDASHIANGIVPLGDELGEPGEAILERLIAAPDDVARVAILDTILTALPLRASHYRDAAIKVQEALLSGVIDDVSNLADTLEIEPRTLHRVCRTAFGFSPVRLLRRQRFLRTLARVRASLDRPLGQLIDEHYYDQAHFNRDFKAYMGMTPRAYYDSPREILRRGGEERRRVLGAQVQGLHVNSSSARD